MFNSLKNSKLIRMVCDQINRLPSPLIGLMMVLAIIIGVFVSVGLGTAAAWVVMFALLSIPYGLGLGVVSLACSIGLWIDFNQIAVNKRDKRFIVQHSIKLWCLATILGFVVLALFPMGRQLLAESQSFQIQECIDAKVYAGISIYIAGWLIISAPKIFKEVCLIPNYIKNFINGLSEIGSSAKNSCTQLEANKSKAQ